MVTVTNYPNEELYYTGISDSQIFYECRILRIIFNKFFLPFPNASPTMYSTVPVEYDKVRILLSSTPVVRTSSGRENENEKSSFSNYPKQNITEFIRLV